MHFVTQGVTIKIKNQKLQKFDVFRHFLYFSKQGFPKK